MVDQKVSPEKDSKHRRVFNVPKWLIRLRLCRGYPFILWLLWDFSGVRFICGKIKPESKGRTDNPRYKQPATFLLWLIGIYVALFGVASQRFENTIDRIENRTNAILALVSKGETRGQALRLIPSVQGMRVQKKPEILNPIITLRSIFLGKTEGHEDSIEILKQTIVGFNKQLGGAFLTRADLRDADLKDANLRRADLTGADLRGADLRGADLRWANLWDADLVEPNLEGAFLEGANLREANLRRATLRRANLSRADLREADLTEADLRNANLVEADLRRADLRGANLRGANLVEADLRKADLRRAHLGVANLRGAFLEGVNLRGADLRGADLRKLTSKQISEMKTLYPLYRIAKKLTSEQLSKVKTLYKAILDADLMEHIKKDYPHLLEKPKDLEQP